MCQPWIVCWGCWFSRRLGCGLVREPWARSKALFRAIPPALAISFIRSGVMAANPRFLRGCSDMGSPSLKERRGRRDGHTTISGRGAAMPHCNCHRPTREGAGRSVRNVNRQPRRECAGHFVWYQLLSGWEPKGGAGGAARSFPVAASAEQAAGDAEPRFSASNKGAIVERRLLGQVGRQIDMTFWLPSRYLRVN